jgi:hypothetical protein
LRNEPDPTEDDAKGYGGGTATEGQAAKGQFAQPEEQDDTEGQGKGRVG